VACAPAPQLGQYPEDGAEFKVQDTMELKWTWESCLPPGWKFSIRLAREDPPHSYQYVDDPSKIRCQDGRTIASYPVKIAGSPFTIIPGTYYWNIIVARKVGEEWGWERLSEVSETRKFTVRQREPPPTPSPTKPPPPTSTP